MWLGWNESGASLLFYFHPFSFRFGRVQHTAPMFVCLLEMKKPNRLTFPAGLDKFPVMCLFCRVGRPSENAAAFFQTAFFTV